MPQHRAIGLVIATGFLALTSCQSSGPRQPHMVASSGDRALEQADFAAAESEYAQVVEAQPWNARARLQYGKALLGVGKNREAREQLEKAYTMTPKNDEVLLNLAEATARSGDYEGAVRLLQTVAEDRRRPTDWHRLGKFAQKAKDYDTAERAFLSAARADGGTTSEYQFSLFNFYREVGREEESLQRLAMAYWLEPKNQELQALIREAGYQPGPQFALRPVEQSSPIIPDPVIPR